MTYRVELHRVEPQPILGIEVRIAIAEIPSVLGQLFEETWQCAAARGTEPTGMPLVWYLEPPGADGSVRFFAALPVSRPVTGEGRVEARELPGGEAATTVHLGPYERLEAAYAAIAQWATDNGRQLRPDVWEVYQTDPAQEPDSAKWRTEVTWPLA
jgi:effector-binding domain-containing protein